MRTWVIGGTSGIGAATASFLAQKGHEVVPTGDEVDVTRPVQLRAWIDSQPKFDNVVFSAGINALNWIGSKSAINDNSDVIDTNLMGFINTVDALASVQVEIHGSPGVMNIVAVSSDAAIRPMRTSMAYCASKAGLDMAVRVAARELGPKGWRVNAVAPGMVEGTEMTRYIDERVPQIRGWSRLAALEYERSQEVVHGRVTVDEVAHLIWQMLDGPDHLNGAIIPLNGGR